MLAAVLIRTDGSFDVIEHDSWDREAIEALLGTTSLQSERLYFRPHRDRLLSVWGGTAAGSPNPFAPALGLLGVGLSGPLLVVCSSRRNGDIVGLDVSELLAVAAHFVAAEVGLSLGAAKGPHRISAGAGQSQPQPQEGATQ